MAHTPITQTISDFPEAPNSATDTPAVFNTKANAFVAHQADIYEDEVNTLAEQMNVVGSETNSNATAADGSATAADGSATAAAASAASSELRAWEAEAEAMTADSYATQTEDVFVDSYTSNGDGTFTATPTTNYSSLHWAAKSEASGIPAPDFPADEGLALVARQTGNDWERVLGMPEETNHAHKTVTNSGVIGDSKWVPIVSNPNVIDTDYTIASGSSGITASGIEIAAGVTVTISVGSVWSIV